MFKINPAPTFRAKVALTVPGAETAAVVEFEFRHKSRSAFVAWWEASQQRKSVDALADIIVSWDEAVVDDAGNPIPYSADALAKMLNSYHAAGTEILTAYYKEL